MLCSSAPKEMEAMRSSSGSLIVFLALVLIVLIVVVPRASVSSPPRTMGAAGVQSNDDPPAKTLKNPVAASAKSVAAGQQLYQKYCRFCHGDSAKGDGTQAPSGSHPRDLTDQAWQKKVTDGEIFASVRDGVAPKFQMKGFRSKLTPQEMWHLVNYVRSLAPQSSR
jgi:mono/diheme cytochrome c family protein